MVKVKLRLQGLGDRATTIFYGALLGVVLFDLVLMLHVFSPFGHPKSIKPHAEYAQKIERIDDSNKPSPFDLIGAKAALGRGRVIRAGHKTEAVRVSIAKPLVAKR